MDKNKIKHSNMMANGFLDAANYLRKCEEKDMLLLGAYAPACTANLAFACELYIKQLLYIKDISFTKIHGLKALFAKIPKDIQIKIEEEYQKDVDSKAVGRQLMTIQECLDTYNTAFEDWRYTYEGKKECETVAEIDFFVFTNAIKKIVDEIIQ